ncbi:MAG: GNAT family N-acetyltransferase [Sedimentisphaerales bacterium]|nr:GNAT family N-acetyltransferase [Sedimentisphaerales bacterium]
MIEYTDNINGVKAAQLAGFFADWPNRPDAKQHLEILQNSYKVWLAFDGDKCIGFINAISDSVFYAYIPLLEVLPEYRARGIGSALLERMTKSLEDMYAIDIVCDESVAPFYEAKNYGRCVGMVKRNYKRQGTVKV